MSTYIYIYISFSAFTLGRFDYKITPAFQQLVDERVLSHSRVLYIVVVQAMILANTFFKTEQVPPSGESTGDTIVGIGSSGRPRRTYLLRDLRDHDLWKHPR